jgi:thioredoxin-like negative regulator of GroEL
LSDKDFEVLLKNKGTAVVELCSEKCERCMCKSVYSQIEEVMAPYTDRITFAYMSLDRYPTTAANFGLQGAPHVLFFREGKMVERIYGYAPTNLINQMIKKYLL